MADDAGCVFPLALLDLNATFDTVDHQILKRLETSHRTTGSTLSWLECYL